MKRYVLLLLILAVTISCSIKEMNFPQSMGDQDVQQIQRDLPSQICAYSSAKFWGETLPMKSSIGDVYIGVEELDYEHSTIYVNEDYKYIQIPINQSGLMDSCIVRFNQIEVGLSPLSDPSKPKTFLIARYSLENDTIPPLFNVVTIIPQPKYMSQSSIDSSDFFNFHELSLNGVIIYFSLEGDPLKVDVLVNGNGYFRGRLGNDREYSDEEVYTKLLFSSENSISQFSEEDQGAGDDDSYWIDEAVIVADSPNNIEYVIDPWFDSYFNPEIPLPGDGQSPPVGGGGNQTNYMIEVKITIEGEGTVTGEGFYYRFENVKCTASPKMIGETTISEFVQWSGYCESTETTISFMLMDNITRSVFLTAKFHNFTPCNDGTFFDPLLDMEICGTPVSGKRGGRFGRTRINSKGNPIPHYGLDLACPPGTPVFSSSNGVVAKVFTSFVDGYTKDDYKREMGDKRGWENGNCIFVESYIEGKLYTFSYSHLTDVRVSPGENVYAGQIIGTSGITGNYKPQYSNGPHLHFHIKEGPHDVSARENSLNPEGFIYTKFDSKGFSINHCK